eukprot:8432376-Lingulodinium_polyedra.AAC.1
MQDWKCFQALEAKVNAKPGAAHLKVLYDRSIFHLLPVMQLVLALQQQDGGASQPSPELHAFLEKKFARWMQSQAAEDGFNICRKAETLAQNKAAPARAHCAPSSSAMVFWPRGT